MTTDFLGASKSKAPRMSVIMLEQMCLLGASDVWKTLHKNFGMLTSWVHMRMLARVSIGLLRVAARLFQLCQPRVLALLADEARRGHCPLQGLVDTRHRHSQAAHVEVTTLLAQIVAEQAGVVLHFLVHKDHLGRVMRLVVRECVDEMREHALLLVERPLLL